MPKLKDYGALDRDQKESRLNIQKVNNGVFLDLLHISKVLGINLPTFIKSQLPKIREEHKQYLQRKIFD